MEKKIIDKIVVGAVLIVYQQLINQASLSKERIEVSLSLKDASILLSLLAIVILYLFSRKDIN